MKTSTMFLLAGAALVGYGIYRSKTTAATSPAPALTPRVILSGSPMVDSSGKPLVDPSTGRVIYTIA